MAFPKIEGYVVTEKLGSGSYSTVYKAYTKVGARCTVAIKCVDKSRLKHSGAAVDNLVTEIRLLKTLTHPHIVHMKHFTWDQRNIYIIMEYCCGGDLSKYIHRYGRVPERQVLYFLQQLASALKFLREKGVVHMDLKPHNLLLHKDSDGKYMLKVGDFGFAQYMSEESMRTLRGSPLYMAPEMLAGEYDAAVDLWSVGVIMYECLFGRAPYSSNTFKELLEKIQSQAPIQIPRNSNVSPGCLDLLTRLLQHDPARRISYEEFFAHEYLDLDHMPSKENYEKAVSLIKLAIELDSGGDLPGAFSAYRDSLRYLVPVVNCETDALRRSALTAKLTRYMERAEELKQYLKFGSSCDLPEVSPSVNGNGRDRKHSARRDLVTCCGRDVTSTTSYDFGDTGTDTDVTSQRDCDPDGRVTELNTPNTDNSSSAETSAGTGTGRTASPSRTKAPIKVGLYKRLFGKQPLPYLDKKDSSIGDECGPEKEQNRASENNEVCRIT